MGADVGARGRRVAGGMTAGRRGGRAGLAGWRLSLFTQCSNEMEVIRKAHAPFKLRLQDQGRIFVSGGVAERLKAPVLKTGMG